MTTIEAQGSQTDFAFHTLGWYEFQNLCAAILRDVLGQTVQIFAPGNDEGRDAAFQGTWQTASGEKLEGTFVAQIKFSRDKTAPLVESLLADEFDNIRDLQSRRLCDNYIVLTNYTTTSARASAVEERVKREAPGLGAVKVYGPDQLREWIRNSSVLRMMVPRVYGIGDISLLLSDHAQRQGAAILKTIGSRLKTIVPTGAYHQAADALTSHGFVLLVGDPMVGKTTIGYALALAAADHFDRKVFTPATPSEFKNAFDPQHSDRFYWIDDAFGETIYNQAAAMDWNRYFSAMHGAIDAGCKIVFTSRSYIWRAARHDLKRSTFPLLDESQVVVQVEQLTPTEREKILYNHLRAGKQSEEFRKDVRPFCERISQLNEFLPESARRLADPHFTRNLTMSWEGLSHFFKEPLSILIESIEQLGPAARSLMAVMFANGSSLASPVRFAQDDVRIAEAHGVEAARMMPELQNLNDTFIRQIVDFSGTTRYVFAHPSLRDALAKIYAQDPEWLRIFIDGAKMVDIVQEVTCGNVGMPGVKLIVPPALFPRFLERFSVFFEEYYALKYGQSQMPYSAEPRRFLAQRTDKAFLELALQSCPQLFKSGVRYSQATSEPWLAILVRLKNFGLLSDELRAKGAQRLLSCADDDLSFYDDPELFGLLSEEEQSALIGTVRLEYAHQLESLADSLADNYSRDYGDPDDYFSDFFGYCDAVKSMFRGDLHYQRLADEGIAYGDSLVSRLQEEYAEPDHDDREDDFSIPDAGAESEGERDIFEDVADPN